MAELAHNVMETESLITPSESPAVEKSTQGDSATTIRKPKAKRSRPKRAADSASLTAASLTRTARRSARSKSGSRAKSAPPAPPITVLNRLLNFSVVIAVFVTALAIQRIVPTEPVTTLKVETLPIQTAESPVAPLAPAPVVTNAAPPIVEPQQLAVPQNQPVAEVVQEPTPTPTPTPPPVVRKPKVAAPRMAGMPPTHTTPLNSGGAEDLDSESARQTYISRSKMATRTPTK